MRALVDGDIVVYRCAFAAQHTIYTVLHVDGSSPEFSSAKEYKEYVQEHEMTEGRHYELLRRREVDPLSHALANVKSVMARIVEQVGEASVFLSKGECFRHHMATIKKYKGNRDNAPRPVYYQEVRDYLTKHYGAITFESIEADDAVAMLQDKDTVIASIDKDLLQVPGRHYDWVKDEKLLVDEAVGHKKLWLQVLTGDSTDNIPGIRGVGPVKAKKLLEDVEPEKYESTVKAHWREYMMCETELAAKDFYNLEVDDETEKVTYVPWYRQDEYPPEPVTRSIVDVVDEIYQLVKVGGKYAEDALKASGEAVLLPRTA